MNWVHSIDFNEVHMFLQDCEWWRSSIALESYYLIFAALTFYDTTYHNHSFLSLWTQLNLEFLFHLLFKSVDITKDAPNLFLYKSKSWQPI